jgi:hypothetical protein
MALMLRLKPLWPARSAAECAKRMARDRLARLLVEEQNLADNGFHGFFTERLGDEEGRFPTFPQLKAFRETLSQTRRGQ